MSFLLGQNNFMNKFFEIEFSNLDSLSDNESNIAVHSIHRVIVPELEALQTFSSLLFLRNF